MRETWLFPRFPACGFLESAVASQYKEVRLVFVDRHMYKTMFKDYPDVLDVDQVCEVLGVSKKTVYRLIKDGSLSKIKVGREYRIPKLYVIRYFADAGVPSCLKQAKPATAADNTAQTDDYGTMKPSASTE
jgi:excisionase family DNA binding protein